jgi:peptidoglycan/LPS O-acetylase OafA/YrhL
MTPVEAVNLTQTPSLLSRVAGRLGRATSSGDFIPEVDGLRCVSIALVILYHTPYYGMPGAPAAFTAVGLHGNFGVQMFFAISGFILGLPFAEEHIARRRKVNIRRYFVRRLTRLEPPYLINLALWFAIKVMFLGRTFAWLFPHLLASMTYTHNWIYHAPSEVNFYAWSLEVEVQFYILAPILALVFTLSRPARLALLGGGIIVTSRAVPGLSLAAQGSWFLVGFLLAEIYLVSWRKAPAHALVWDIVAMVAWPALFACLAAPGTAMVWRMALPWVLLTAYAASFRSAFVSGFLRFKPIYIVGGMCYSIYLYHGYVLQVVLTAQRRYFMTGRYWVDTVGGLLSVAVAVLSVSSLAFVVFEKPFMRPRWHLGLWSHVTSRARTARLPEISKP